MAKPIGQIQIENKVQELRVERGMTQEELGQAVSVTRATIISLEKGSYNPSLELAMRLAKFFNTEVNKLFFEKGKK